MIERTVKLEFLKDNINITRFKDFDDLNIPNRVINPFMIGIKPIYQSTQEELLYLKCNEEVPIKILLSKTDLTQFNKFSQNKLIGREYEKGRFKINPLSPGIVYPENKLCITH